MVKLDGYLAGNLDILKKNVKRDWDFWLLVDGREGSGKSTLAMQTAKYLDPSFNIKRVVFTPNQFSYAVDNSNRYEAIVWDESVTGTQSIDMTKMARTLKSKAVQLRQKNLFVILVIHSFFDMNKYYSVHRTWFLLHVYYTPNEERKTFDRGVFEFYDFDKKKNMYLNDKYRRFYHYGIKPNFRGRFSKEYAVNKDLYLEKKANIEEKENIGDMEYSIESIRRGMPIRVLRDYVGTSERHLYRVKKQMTK